MKNWIKIHQKLPSVKWIDQDIFEIDNVRNCKYDLNNKNSEFNPNEIIWEKVSNNINNLNKVWFIENNYAIFQSHIMLSFEFEENGKSSFITVSAEVRKEGGQDFEVWYVLYKDYNIFYIWSLEEDIVFLRSNLRKSYINIFELDLDKDEKVALFKSLALNTNEIANGKSVIYKLFKTDCVNTMLFNFIKAKINVEKYYWDYSPMRVLWRSNLIKDKEKYKGFVDFKNKTLINPENIKVRNLEQNSSFSFKIREILNTNF